MALLTTTATLALRWSLSDAEIDSIANVGNLRELVTVSDDAVSNAVWTDSRTIAGETVETFDLAALPYEVFGLGGTFTFDRVHQFYLVNASEDEDAELRIGTPDNLTIGHYAMSVWQKSFAFLNSSPGWVPGDLLRIANPTTTPIPYRIVLIGLGEVTVA